MNLIQQFKSIVESISESTERKWSSSMDVPKTVEDALSKAGYTIVDPSKGIVAKKGSDREEKLTVVLKKVAPHLLKGVERRFSG